MQVRSGSKSQKSSVAKSDVEKKSRGRPSKVEDKKALKEKLAQKAMKLKMKSKKIKKEKKKKKPKIDREALKEKKRRLKEAKR